MNREAPFDRPGTSRGDPTRGHPAGACDEQDGRGGRAWGIAADAVTTFTTSSSQ